MLELGADITVGELCTILSHIPSSFTVSFFGEAEPALIANTVDKTVLIDSKKWFEQEGLS